jgi:hypothetical protein
MIIKTQCSNNIIFVWVVILEIISIDHYTAMATDNCQLKYILINGAVVHIHVLRMEILICP